MTTQALYRKYRPPAFRDMAGQEHITTTLKNAVKLGRIAHAYILSGPRGSGKTTTARILAKAASCSRHEDGDACNQCDICRAISGNFHQDLIEADAASNRRATNIEDILSTVPLAPVEAKKKFYIIDEVHMLTQPSFTILGQAIENSPDHVHFVLCTTEPEKLPPQVTSRCQQMHFRRIPIDIIAGKLAMIAQEENVPVDQRALETIAQDATGSLRDAESTLERMLVTFPEGFTHDQVTMLTGTGTSRNAMSLIRHMAQGNAQNALKDVSKALWETSDIPHFHQQTSNLLRALMHIQAGAGKSVNLPEHVRAQLTQIAGEHPDWPTATAIRTWHSIDVRRNQDDPKPLETTAVTICQLAAPPATQQPPPQQPQQRQQPANQQTTRQRPAEPDQQAAKIPQTWDLDLDPNVEFIPSSQTQTQPQPDRQDTPMTNQPQPAHDPINQPGLAEKWNLTVRDLSRTKGQKYNLGAILRDCRPQNITMDQGHLTLPLNNPANLDRINDELQNPGSRDHMQNAIAKHFGEGTTFQLTTTGPRPTGPDQSRPQGNLLGP